MEAHVLGEGAARAPVVAALMEANIAVATSATEQDVTAVTVVVVADAEDATAAVVSARGDAGARPVVVVAREGAVDAWRLIEAGADGVVWDAHAAARIAPTVYAVVAGQLAFPREGRTRLERPTLSAREKQVLALLVLGFTNGEIAAKLVLTESTVKSHLASSYRKLGVASRNDAVALILDGLGTGILSIPDAERIDAPPR